MIGRCTCIGSVLILAGLTAGCTRGTGNVSGTVKFKGQPLPAGTITFYDQDNKTASSAIIDGAYEVTKVGVGPVKVAIAVPMYIPFAGPALPGAKAPTAAVPKSPSIPPKYLDREESGLGFEVIRGDQKKDFDLLP